MGSICSRQRKWKICKDAGLTCAVLRAGVSCGTDDALEVARLVLVGACRTGVTAVSTRQAEVSSGAGLGSQRGVVTVIALVAVQTRGLGLQQIVCAARTGAAQRLAEAHLEFARPAGCGIAALACALVPGRAGLAAPAICAVHVAPVVVLSGQAGAAGVAGWGGSGLQRRLR